MAASHRTIVADNGAFHLRIGFADEAAHMSQPQIVMPNQTAIIRGDGRELIGDETEAAGLSHHELLEYRRAHQRGCLLDGNVEEKVWNHALSRMKGFADYSEKRRLLVTESPLSPQASKKVSDELFFEKLKFDYVARVYPSTCVAVDRIRRVPEDDFAKSVIRIVVDCGYSATWIVPLLGCNPCFPSACKRVDVGGKLLTNLLKEEITWRQVNVMDDTFVVEKCKKDVCYVAENWRAEKPAFVEYLLPDHSKDTIGRLLRPGEEVDRNVRQTIRLGQERINIPEVLFSPSRIGLDEAGIAEAIYQCINDLPWELRDQARSNVLVTGGSSRFPGFMARLQTELASFGCNSFIDWSEHYEHSAWQGAAALANSEEQYMKAAVSRKQYLEEGSHRTKSTKSSGVAWWSA